MAGLPLSLDQAIVFATLAAALVLFVTGWLRHDLVAVLALLVLVVSGVIRPGAAFAGFANGAVISVAAVLIMGQGLRKSGVVEVLADRLGGWGERLGQSGQIALLGTVVSLLSAVINDVGTLALFMPVASKLARRQNTAPGRILMPLSYASLFGGMLTLIGTSVNLLVSAYRAHGGHPGFSIFAFTPVGIGIAGAGLAFTSLIGWRLLPDRRGSGGADLRSDIAAYLTEVHVPDGAKAIGRSITAFEATTDGAVSVVSLMREGNREVAPAGYQKLRPHDVLVLRGDSESLESAIAAAGLELEPQKQHDENRQRRAAGDADGETKEDAARIIEAVVVPGAAIAGRSALGLRLRDRFAVNLLALARNTRIMRSRLRDIRFRPGDVLLLQGASAALAEACSDLGLAPLAERELRLGHPRRVAAALAIFAATLGIAASGLMNVAVCLTGGAVAMVLAGLLRLDDVYASLEGPVLVLIAAMVVVAGALQSSGGSRLVAAPLLSLAQHLPPWGAITLVYVAAMMLSNVTNYVATAMLMAPIATAVAAGLHLAQDPFLMAVAYGSVSTFVTPIGHPCNMLVLGPGGYRFADYARMGIPVSILSAGMASLLIPLVFPLHGR